MAEPLSDKQLQALERPTYHRRADFDNVLDARAAAEIRKRRTDNAKLREYVKHKQDCLYAIALEFKDSIEGECDCGLDDILKEADK